MKRVHCARCKWTGPLRKIRTHMAKAHPGSLSGHKRKSTAGGSSSHAAANSPSGLPIIQCPRCGQLFVPS